MKSLIAYGTVLSSLMVASWLVVVVSMLPKIHPCGRGVNPWEEIDNRATVS
jgi:hypothetical protein